MRVSCSRSPIAARREVARSLRREVAPWVAAIERLWDDPEFESRHRELAKAEAQRWEWDRVADQYERFFKTLLKPTGELTKDAPV